MKIGSALTLDAEDACIFSQADLWLNLVVLCFPDTIVIYGIRLVSQKWGRSIIAA
jgi:hypothetical protein